MGSSMAIVCCERLGQAEIQDLHAAFGSHLHIGGFQVAVDDRLFAVVRSFQRLGNLLGDRQGFLDRDGRPSRSIRSRSVSPGTSSITR